MKSEKAIYIGEHEAARICGLSVSTLRNWRFQRKNLPYVKLDRAVRYKLEDVLDYMESNRIDLGTGGAS